MSFGPEPQPPIQIAFRGSPALPDVPREHSRWKMFVTFFAPWLKDKYDLGEAYLAAKVEKELASARETNSAALVNVATAKKIAMETAEIAERLDRERAKEVKPIVKAEELTAQETEESLAAELEALQAKIDELHYRRGTEIKLLSNKTVAEDEG